MNGASPLAAFSRWSGEADIATLLQEAEANFKGPSYLLALPYLYGERTPLNDPLARAALVGMFTGLDGDGPFGGNGATGVWRSLLTDEYAKSFAKAGGIGIADQVYRTLIAQQEARQ